MAAEVMYLVRRTAWQPPYEPMRPTIVSAVAYQEGKCIPGAAGECYVPVAVFATRSDAEFAMRELEARARDGVCPFWFREYSDELAGIDDEEALPLAMAGCVSPPPPGQPRDGQWFNVLDRWAAWWDAHAGDWTPEQRNAVWDLFDKLRFYEVVEIPVED